MSVWRQLTRGLGVLTNRSAADRDLDDELRHYIEQATDAHLARGLSPVEARRQALIEVGSATAVKQQVRDYGWETVIGALFADVRFAARMLRKSPLFTIVVVFVIALGSGAVTTIFSAMNAVVLRPLAGIPDVSRLVTLRPARPDGTTADQGSYASYAYLRDRSHTLDGIVGWGKVSLTITAGGQGTAVFGNMVSGNYFEVLGVRPALGRFFAEDEDRTPGSHPVIVVSHAFWTAHLGGDGTAVGRSVLVNGLPFTVIGVAPTDFRGVYTGLRADAWVPLMMQPQLRPRSNLTNASWLWQFGRLRDGSTPAGTQQELSAIAAARATELGLAREGKAFTLVRVAGLTGLPNGESGPLLVFMSILLGAASLVLLIAGVNVAAMLSARYVTRRREMAVRAALGAGRTRLVRQLLTEVLSLFVLGALGGFVISVLATAALERLPLPASIPLSLELTPDLRVLAFAVGVSLLTGLVFGLAPALRAARGDLTARLRDDAPGSGSRQTFVGRGLIVGQLALSLVLLISAGLFMRALDRGQRIDPGFELAGVNAASLEPESWGYDEAAARAFYRTLRERIEALPGVTAVSYAGRLPLMMGSSPDDITIDGATGTVAVNTASIDTGYFAVLRLPLLQGRAFQAADDDRAARVAVVNETLARRLWPDASGLGRSFRFRGTVTTIVGIARDAKYATLDEVTPSFVYFPVAQIWQPGQALLVRTAADSEYLAPAIERAVLSVDPQVPRPRVTTLRESAAIVLLPQRAAAIVTGVLGGVGLLLAAVGLYGMMAFSATRRTREIGIRVALGAGRGSVVGMMIREGMRLAAAGIVIGLVLAAVATQPIAGWLFNVSRLDAVTFASVSVVFLVVALVASYLPARRAASLDPLKALRAD